jgi:acyl phosphate:glycerol-3-phosphate acyltransferase
MTTNQLLLSLIPLSYLSGSIPFGLLIGKLKGVDPRNSGSGNIGATNLGRLLGYKYFVLVFILDFLKGALPCVAAGAVVGFHAGDQETCLLWIAVAGAALLGHVCSIFLKFKGGKGVSISAGVMLGIYPYFTFAGLIGFAAFCAVFLLTRYISASSITGAIVFAAAFIGIGLWQWSILGAQLPLLCFAILIPIVIVFKHRGNLARLRAGTEPQFVRKST